MKDTATPARARGLFPAAANTVPLAAVSSIIGFISLVILYFSASVPPTRLHGSPPTGYGGPDPHAIGFNPTHHGVPPQRDFSGGPPDRAEPGGSRGQPAWHHQQQMPHLAAPRHVQQQQQHYPSTAYDTHASGYHTFLTALCGAIAALSLLLPLLYWLWWLPQQARHRVELETARAQTESIMQAMAFAAHEIRNPLHAVAASLESALHDLLPLYKVLVPGPGAGEGAGWRGQVPAVEDAAGPDEEEEEEEKDDGGALVRPEDSASVRSRSSSASSGNFLPPRGHSSGGNGAQAANAGQATQAGQAMQAALGHRRCEAVRAAIEDIGIAKGGAENCHRLVNDMVDMSALQKGQMSITRAPMDVRTTLRRLMESQRAFVRPEVGMWLRVHQSVPESIYIDEGRFLQVIINSMTNAAKFTFSGNIWLTAVVLSGSNYPSLRMEHNAGDEWLCVAACDTGKGLAHVDVDRLFEPMTTSRLEDAAAAAGEDADLSWRAVMGRAWDGMVRACKTALSSILALPGGGGGAVQPPSVPVVLQGAVTTPRLAVPASPAPSVSASKTASRGSGLGLPVARLMARALGGDIDLYVEHETPIRMPVTRFIFMLPMSAVDPMRVYGAGPATVCHLYGRNQPEVRQQTRALIREAFSGCVADVEQTMYLNIPPSQHRGGLGEQPAAVIRPSVQSAALHCTNRDRDAGCPPCGRRTGQPRGSPTAEATAESTGGLFSRSRSDSTGSRPGRRQDLQVDVHRWGGQAASGTGLIPLAAAMHRPQTPSHIESLLTAAKGASTYGTPDGSSGIGPYTPSASSGLGGAARGSGSGSGTSGSTPVSGRRVQQPAGQTQRGTPMGQSAGQQGTSTGSGTPKQSVLRVLYADDDAVNRRLMGRLLRHFDGTKTVAGRTVQCKVELQTVDDGWQAIQALYRAGHVGAAIFRRAVDTMQAHHPHWQGLQEEEEAVRAGHSTSQSQDTPPFDLLLLDIDMPHFSGAQIASFLQESAAGQGASEPPQPARTWLGRVPVLAVTGRSVSFNITHGWARAAGMQQELQAPDWARIAVEEIADESLRGVFHGTLGKPFTAGQLGMVAGLALGYQHSLQA